MPMLARRRGRIRAGKVRAGRRRVRRLLVWGGAVAGLVAWRERQLAANAQRPAPTDGTD